MVEIQVRGITFTTTGTATSVLTVQSSTMNNNTEVVCIARNLQNGERIRSPTAYLIIQG